MQKEWELVKEFSLPGELSLSITYLQRALRDCVFQHQVLASKINNLPMHQRPRVKQYMLELEREMLSIGQEQEGLVRQLSERVKRFQMTVQSKHLVTLSDDLLYGFVTRQLAAQHETAVIPTAPKHISQRWSATELAQKFSLETILGLVVVKKEDIKPEPVGPLEQQSDEDEHEDDEDEDESRWKPVMSISDAKRYNKQAKSAPKMYQSLLKRKPSVGASQDMRHFAGIADRKQAQTTTSEANVKSEKIQKMMEDPPPPPPAAPVEASDDEDPAESVLRGAWVPGCPGRPPKAAKYLSAAKLAQIRARRASVPVGLKATVAVAAIVPQQKRASKRIEAVSEKMKPIEPESMESGEDEEQLEVMATSAAVRRGRSNLLQALKKQKRGPGRPSLASLAQKGPKRGGGPVASVGKLVKHPSFSASSGSSPNSRSSTPTWGNATRQQSDDSCDRRSSSTEYRPLLLNDPGETTAPGLTSIYEMEQDAFLRYFGLHTPEEAKALKERKRERKRRSCYSTERKDFHYGKLDYYEQQQQYQAARATKRTHQRPILYSPPVAVAKRRKQPTLPSAGSSSSSSGSIARHQHHHIGHQRPQPANIFAAMDKRACFVCLKSGTTDELGACTNCYNIYHLNCHTVDERSEAYRQRDNLCPVCLISDDK